MKTAIERSVSAPGMVAPSLADIAVVGEAEWPSWYRVSDLAQYSLQAVAAAVKYHAGELGLSMNELSVDRALASHWFNRSFEPLGWSVPPIWDELAGYYETRNGWIQLHTNAPHHRQAALSALAAEGRREAVAAVTRQADGDVLEQAIVDAGGCAAQLRTEREWLAHPQGQAVAESPLVEWQSRGQTACREPQLIGKAPLAGIRVLDLTRIIAGPVATRTLAAFGATVLRIDPLDWQEDNALAEMTLGKYRAGLDLATSQGKNRLGQLLQDADILVHGYRPGALTGLGFDAETLQTLNPDLIEIALCAWGWRGPMAERRGFDSLVQTGSGIAAYGGECAGSDKPEPLPVQALDHATGYLMAACALNALSARRFGGQVYSARLSLAATGHLLKQARCEKSDVALAAPGDDAYAAQPENTPWGLLKRLKFPITGIETSWPRPVGVLRSDEPVWPVTILNTV